MASFARAGLARLAYVEVPDFPLAALARADRSLDGRPVVIVTGGGTHARILCASTEARTGGITVGLGAARARQRMPELLVRPPSTEAEQAAQAALLEVAFAFSPRIEDAGPGTVYVDLGGTEALYPSESGVATAMDAALERLGLPCRVGVAGGRTVARLAARQVALGVRVVPAGYELAFLAPLPLADLEASPEALAQLRGWGIRTLGELAALSSGAVARRLGPEGVRLRDRARGRDDRPFVSAILPPLFEQVVRLDDWAIPTLEPLLAVLGQAIEELLVRLAAAGQALRAVTVTLELDPRGHDVRHIEFAAPLAQLKAIMALARHDLYRRPPPAAVTGLRVVGLPAVPQAVQGHLFAPPDPTPEFLATTLARLRALVGEESLGAPARPAAREPAALATAPFAPPSAAVPAPWGPHLASWGPHPAPLVARVLRPPRPIAVHGSPPESIRLDGQILRVRAMAGPWRLRDGWWTADPVDREDYDVELADGRLARIYRDRRRDAWFLDGLYG